MTGSHPPISHLKEENAAFPRELGAKDLVEVVHQHVSILGTQTAKLCQKVLVVHDAILPTD